MSHRLGIDVGGTHTDAVILDEKKRLVAKTKARTTPDVTSGIVQALKQILEQPGVDRRAISVAMLGTTHCTNAIAERKHLSKVGVIRMGAPATLAIPPLFSWPPDLREVVTHATAFTIHGGHEFDGREISKPDQKEIDGMIRQLVGKVDAVAVTAVFAPVNPAHEKSLALTLQSALGDDVPITLSHEIGSLGLLERENATILNSALMKTAQIAFSGFAEAIARESLRARLFLGQNDGTLMGLDYALRYPIFTIASGPSNSLRGGAFLSNLKDAIVVDVGGTTTDVGVLVGGFPRESAIAVDIGGVRTNFRMPDLISIGLGGGSLVRRKTGSVSVGPDSVGYRLEEEAIVFGGKTLTATDIAVAMGRANLGDPKRLARITQAVAKPVDRLIRKMIEGCIDRLKLSPAGVPVVLVGGGSILLPDEIEGASEIHRPANFDVANAIGVAIAPVSAEIDRLFSYTQYSRQEALQEAQKLAIEKARLAGADPNNIEIVELEEIAMAYLPEHAVRVKVKAAGPLSPDSADIRATAS
jgi:N-methylhydantoinase A/oxoprolinase/acetone carboxylase beta subunit